MVPETLLKEYEAFLIKEAPGEIQVRLKSGKVITLSRNGDRVDVTPGLYDPKELELINKLKTYV